MTELNDLFCIILAVSAKSRVHAKSHSIQPAALGFEITLHVIPRTY